MLSYSSLRVNAFHCASSTLGLADSYPVAGEVCRAMIPSLGYNPAMATDSDWVIGSAPQSIEYVEISLHPLCVYTHICACYCQYWLWSSIIRAYKASTARHAALRSISSQMKSVVILADCEGIAVFKVQSHPRNTESPRIAVPQGVWSGVCIGHWCLNFLQIFELIEVNASRSTRFEKNDPINYLTN